MFGPFSTSSSLSSYLSLAILARLATMSLSTAAPDHWILTQIPSIAMARMDPIVNPNAVSGHVHNIMGGSNFHQSLNSPDVQVAADCSSAIIGDDKSNYWAPLLYYQYENGTFAPMLGQNRIYYFTKTNDVKPFPPGLRMISGLAMTRNESDTKSLGVRISCNHGLQTKYLPNSQTNPGGCQAIALGIYFPSCGLASGALDSQDHFSHMAWPQSYDGPNLVDDPNGIVCPDSHPIKYPTIFMEANYYTGFSQPWRNDPNLLVLSTGDTTGLGYHADFYNGWDQDVLTQAIAQCGNGKGPGDQLHDCAPLAKSMSEDNAYSCRYQSQLPAEDIGIYQPIKALPGCNPLWTADMPDTKPKCDSPAENPGFASPNVAFENLLYRMHIPMTASWVTDTSKEWLQAFIPGLGMLGASKILPWGDTDGTNDHSLSIGSLGSILAAAVGGGENSAPSSSAVSSSASASASASSTSSTSSTEAAASSTSVIGNVAVAQSSTSAADPTSTTSSATATSTKGPAKTCIRKAKKRDLVSKRAQGSKVERSESTRDDVRRHFASRSKRAGLRH